MTWRRLSLLALVPVALWLLHARRHAPRAAAPPAELALLVSRGLGGETALHFVTGGDLGAPAATFTHLPDATVRGALLPGTRTVIATADRTPVRDHAFDAALLRVEAGREAAVLCDRVDHAARPLVSSDGRVFIGRGTPGSDLLTVDEIDAKSGAARVIYSGRAYHASPVAVHRDHLWVYSVASGMAELHGLRLDGSHARTVLGELMPFARDFTLDGDSLVFANRDARRSDLWIIEAIDLRTGARRVLHRSMVSYLAPHVWPGGDLAFDDGRGLTLLAGGRRAPLGTGVDVVRALSADGRWAAAWHYAPRALQPDVALLSSTGALQRTIAAPDDRTRLEIVGFVGSAR